METHLFWGQKVEVTSHKQIDSVGLCIPVSAGFFYVIFIHHPN